MQDGQLQSIVFPAPYPAGAAVLATRHGKEQALAPAFPALQLHVPEDLDTDSLGTFTGEVPREGTMREAARRKAMMGVRATGLPLALASEGSFGPHPMVPFLACGRELLIFIDMERGLEIVEESLSGHTNFAALDLAPGADIDGFLARVGFPSHGVLLRGGNGLLKGITRREDLDRAIAGASSPSRIETDMRAHLNPTRMGEIGRLARKLARRLATPCPSCAAPGFGSETREQGLPCSECGAGTMLVRAILTTCPSCGHVRRAPRPDGRQQASPAECQECNP